MDTSRRHTREVQHSAPAFQYPVPPSERGRHGRLLQADSHLEQRRHQRPILQYLIRAYPICRAYAHMKTLGSCCPLRRRLYLSILCLVSFLHRLLCGQRQDPITKNVSDRLDKVLTRTHTFVIHIFVPFRIQPPSTFFAVVFILTTSDPAECSDIASAPILSPEIKPGSSFSFCSRVPLSESWLMQSCEWAA